MAEQITIVGLGPGGAEMLTREAREALSAAGEVWVRTSRHPAVAELPDVAWRPMDSFYERADGFSDVYKAIAAEVLRLGERPEGVCYAVPGSPRVGESTVAQIQAGARERGLTVRIVEGLSFIEPILGALGVDALDGLYVSDAAELAARHHPPFPPSAHALIAQLYSRTIATEAKLTLMNQYPEEHPVRLVHAAGTAAQSVEDLPLHAIDRSRKHRAPHHPVCSAAPGRARGIPGDDRPPARAGRLPVGPGTDPPHPARKFAGGVPTKSWTRSTGKIRRS